MDNRTDFLDLLRHYLESSRDETERVQQELRENDELVRQGTSEVERLTQRNSQLRSKLAAMEGDLEAHSRSEIRSLYQAASEAQLRLFIMRNRVEQLQSKQQILTRHLQSLQGFASLVQFLPSKEALAHRETAAAATASSKVSAAASSLARVIAAQEEERLALARQVHDGPAQSLTNLILQAELCERLFARDPEQARQELANLKGFAAATFQKIRDFIFELRPMMLDDLGLVPTMRRYVTAFEGRTGVSVHAQYIGQERRLASQVEILLFRGVQELLNNVVQHADASHVQLVINLQGNPVMAVVEDDGTGFNVAEALSDNRATHSVGLTALRDRVEMLGGAVQFDSTVGRGTRISVRVPLPDPAPTVAAG